MDLGAPADQPDRRSAVYLRRTFQLKAAPKRATVYATAAGLYELHINGKRVGDACFTPGWTNYDKRLYYQAYDVTDLLRSGENVIGAILGEGWYGLHHGGQGKLALLAQLHVEYADGTQETVATDPAWKADRDGPILVSDMYQGECYDARKGNGRLGCPRLSRRSWGTATSDPLGPAGDNGPM